MVPNGGHSSLRGSQRALTGIGGLGTWAQTGVEPQPRLQPCEPQHPAPRNPQSIPGTYLGHGSQMQCRRLGAR